IIMTAGFVIAYFMKHSWHQNPLGIKSFGGYAILVLLLWLISKINQGISKRNVLFNNTSSIVELIKFAKKHPEYGYVFTDFGNQDSFGYLCLRDYLTDKDKKITFVDTIGNDKNNILKLSHEELKDSILTDWFTHSEFLTSGRLKDGKVYQDAQVGSYENDEDLIIQA
ncbi:MAG TPA: hypothetical protein VKY25_05015, partial [Erysipelothrix sp.]|nr:hypothetical protein [Erysipelothrix sp.]